MLEIQHEKSYYERHVLISQNNFSQISINALISFSEKAIYYYQSTLHLKVEATAKSLALMPTIVSAPVILYYQPWAPACIVRAQNIYVCLHSQSSSVSNSSVKDYRLSRPFSPKHQSLSHSKLYGQNYIFYGRQRSLQKSL